MPYIWAPKTPTLAMGRELHIDDTGQQARAKAHIREQVTGGWLWVFSQCHSRYRRSHRRTATAESGGGCCWEPWKQAGLESQVGACNGRVCFCLFSIHFLFFWQLHSTHWEAVGLLLPLSKCGHQADESQFGDIYGTSGKENFC